jgi:hypothetical protein
MQHMISSAGRRIGSAEIRHLRGRSRYPDRRWALVIAARPREGRIQRAVRRCFVAGSGKPRCSADFLRWAYPRLDRYQGWQRWSVRRALLKYAIPVGRGSGRGCPVIWAPNSRVEKPHGKLPGQRQ